jgi:hypothetical protein
MQHNGYASIAAVVLLRARLHSLPYAARSFPFCNRQLRKFAQVRLGVFGEDGSRCTRLGAIRSGLCRKLLELRDLTMEIYGLIQSR